MNLVDTHCHLDFPDFDRDRADVINRARESGIVRMINISSSLEGCRKTLELIKKFDFIYGAIGVHPHDASSVTDEILLSLKEMAGQKKVAAIGEVGLDYYRNLSPREKQKEVFLKFISFSGELELPLVIHSRDSLDEVLAILKSVPHSNLRGVVHCFSGDSRTLGEVLEMGLFVSFTCNLTFKNAGNLREIARNVPLERLLLETDAPFLAPQAFRGKRNEPAYIVHLAETLAQIKGVAKEKIAEITTRNANELFRLEI